MQISLLPLTQFDQSLSSGLFVYLILKKKRGHLPPQIFGHKVMPLGAERVIIYSLGGNADTEGQMI